MEKISQTLKRLKAAAAVNDDFSKMVNRLTEEGIFDNHRLTGEVTIFDNSRGYGFIRVVEGESYFLHIQEIEGRQYPVRGDRFKFNVTGKNRANKAVKIN